MRLTSVNQIFCGVIVWNKVFSAKLLLPSAPVVRQVLPAFLYVVVKTCAQLVERSQWSNGIFFTFHTSPDLCVFIDLKSDHLLVFHLSYQYHQIQLKCCQHLQFSCGHVIYGTK